MKLIFLIFLALMLTAASKGYAFQDSYGISGVVKDKKGETLPGANVLLSGYQKGAVADNDGKFVITALRPGNYDVLVQMMGYLPASINVIVDDKSVVVDIVMTENARLLKEVVIRPDANRERYLKAFKESFVGTSPNAQKTKILNPNVIRFEYDSEALTLQATADEFIILENKELGYKIKYLLKYFEKDDRLNLIRYFGYPYFEDLASSKSKARQYKERRDLAYMGSAQHFFTSLFDNSAKSSGFMIYKMEAKPNPQKLPDSILDEKIQRFTQLTTRGAKLTTQPGDSLRYYKQMKSLPDTIDILNRNEVLTDTLVKQEVSNLRWMNYRDKLYIVYSLEKESKAYSEQRGYKIRRPHDLAQSQVSIVRQHKPLIAFYENGMVFDPSALLFEGYWGYEKVADMVPMDYIP
ncbi:MAG TPA: carboxypeptidase-like regulatory domain-containing protein [Pedobacter sp.]|nr:carboxypeptidase-like regulatory domain-containing protein [Pedobacter sp.]